MDQAIKVGAEARLYADAGKWVVDFYEVTKQPEKARKWREKLAKAHPQEHSP